METVEKSLLLLDLSTVSMARHFHSESLALCSSVPSPFFRPQIPPKTQKVKEQSGNVYENKGPLWRTRAQSWNVHENKGTYKSKAGMLLKTKDVDGMS